MVDDQTLARNFTQNVINCLFVCSDTRFQQSVWMGDADYRRFLDDYVELINILESNVGWLLEGDFWTNVPLTREQAQALRSFWEALEQFDAGLPKSDSEAVMADPRWPAIVEAAKRTLEIVMQGTHGLRPQVGG